MQRQLPPTARRRSYCNFTQHLPAFTIFNIAHDMIVVDPFSSALTRV